MADAGASVSTVLANKRATGLKIDGTRVVGTQHTAIADAVTNHAIADAAADMAQPLEDEIQGFLDAISVKLNLVIAAMEKHGLIVTP